MLANTEEEIVYLLKGRGSPALSGTGKKRVNHIFCGIDPFFIFLFFHD